MNINEITEFFGWCTAINLGVYIFSIIFIIMFKQFTTNIHSKLIGVDKTKLPSLYFNFLGNYKIGIIFLNLVPYIALNLMTM